MAATAGMALRNVPAVHHPTLPITPPSSHSGTAVLSSSSILTALTVPASSLGETHSRHYRSIGDNTPSASSLPLLAPPHKKPRYSKSVANDRNYFDENGKCCHPDCPVVIPASARSRVHVYHLASHVFDDRRALTPGSFDGRYIKSAEQKKIVEKYADWLECPVSGCAYVAPSRDDQLRTHIRRDHRNHPETPAILKRIANKKIVHSSGQYHVPGIGADLR